jgi:N-acylneuraminate cytidylyltransferase/3-deoxy-D-manno-octulosonate 8-phosphate phosphatase (KDO 8-P phosphatase)
LNFRNIKAVVFDFDGVFTDNRVIVSENGKESVICNRSDGIGLEMLRKLDMPMTIISTEKNLVVSSRAKKLKIPVVHGVKNKIRELEKFSKSINIGCEYIAFVGNDINDTECMEKVGFPIAVADAVEDIKAISSFLLNNKGGDGAVRELCELIYKAYQNG